MRWIWNKVTIFIFNCLVASCQEIALLSKTMRELSLLKLKKWTWVGIGKQYRAGQNIQTRDTKNWIYFQQKFITTIVNSEILDSTFLMSSYITVRKTERNSCEQKWRIHLAWDGNSMSILTLHPRIVFTLRLS